MQQCVTYVVFWCTVSANGLTILDANQKYEQKFYWNRILHNQDAKNMPGLQGYSLEQTRGILQQLSQLDGKIWLKSLLSVHFMAVAVDFSTCVRHLVSGVALRILFLRSFDGFVIFSDDAAKSYKLKNNWSKFVRTKNDAEWWFCNCRLFLALTKNNAICWFDELETRGHFWERTHWKTCYLFECKRSFPGKQLADPFPLSKFRSWANLHSS